jgi:protoheme IX farnesyltransferase
MFVGRTWALGRLPTVDKVWKAGSVAALDPHAKADPVGTAKPSPGIIRSYIALTKPRIIELLLVTTVPTMILAAGGWPAIGTMIAVIVGGALAAGGASTFNSVYDRDIDRHMTRTAHRPVASGVISARAGLIFGSVLSIASVVILGVFTNVLAAALAVVAIFAYSVGYTIWLKRRTAQNIVWGGAAGCMPVLIGWAAVTGSLTWTPVVLFLIVFWWTPPHYWPLSLRYRDDYAAAGVPMLPVIAAPGTVMKHIAVYSVLMVVTSWALIPLAPMGWVYGVTAGVLGVLFLAEVVRLGLQVRAGVADPAPMRLFHGSITYLSLLFLAVAVDPFV